MELTGQIILAFLEEDDPRRILFRTRPLLSASGPIGPEHLEEYGQDGFLRIAPDKREQHSFKDRMRSLGSLCLLNLVDATPAMGKIRPNKNYAPARGEKNRQIVYSDIVQALPENLVYEVVPEERGAAPLTRKYFLRSGGRISGPFCQSGMDCPASHSLPPDSERLFFVEMPDGTSRLFFWPQEQLVQQPAAAPEETVKEPEKAQVTEPDAEPEPQAAVPAHASGILEEAPAPVPAANAQALPDGPPRKAAAQPVAVMEDEAQAAPAKAAAEFQGFTELAQEMHKGLAEAGFNVTLHQTAELILLCLCAPRVQLTGSCMADAHLAARTMCSLLPEDVAVLGDNSGMPQERTLLFCSDEPLVSQAGSHSYLQSPWPVYCIFSGDTWPAITRRKPLQMNGLKESMTSAGREYPPQVRAWMDEIAARIRKAGFPLPLQLRDSMAAYLAFAPRLCGMTHEEALRAAAKMWVIPWLRFSGIRDGEILEMVRA